MGTDVHVTSKSSNEKKEEEYRESDIVEVVKDSHPNNWDDMLLFIKKKADSEWHLTPGEVKAMYHDFEKAKQEGESFTTDPKKLYEEVHKFHQSH